MTARRLAPAIASEDFGDPTDAAALWVGLVDLAGSDLDSSGLDLAEGEAFAAARLLVRESGCVRGFVEVPVRAGHVSSETLRAALGALPSLARTRVPVSEEAISVVLCTRDRPADLRRCLASIMALSYSAYEVIVVDSASSTTAVREQVEALGSDRVRYIRVEQPGLSRARNAGVRAASHDLVAFTDDDVTVDAEWLRGISEGFATGADVACVTGIVASGQLLTRAQRSIDRRLTWSRNTEVTRFSLDHPPAAYPLFPFQFGAYGTGANFAARRSVLFELGGFDEALGVGTVTGGGEDIDWFTRVVLAGHALLYQPDAVVWHKHRRTDAELAVQLADFRVALGAVLAKLCGDRTARRAMLPMLPRSGRHAGRMVLPHPSSEDDGPRLRNSARELVAIARGPFALRRARRNGRATPLLADRPHP